jgi:hypothetical protein
VSPVVESVVATPPNMMQPPPQTLQNPVEQATTDDDLDEDIVDSIARMGFNRSQIVSQLLGEENAN